MKTRYKIIIGIIAILATLFVYHEIYQQNTHYKTWGNNEHWYYHPDGYEVECEIRLFQTPGQCKAVDENGIIVDTKTTLGNWNGVKWLHNSDYCKDQGGVWNNTTSGCYGLYEICENNGGVPRFLKESLPFPDIEENKPVQYLMDCYDGYIVGDDQFTNGILPHYTRYSDTSGNEIIQVIKSDDETLENFEGVIFDKSLGPGHWYNFFTNDPFKTFNTGSTGITLEGINSMDNLHGDIVKISGIRTDRDLGIQVYELQIFGSLIPSSTTGSVSNMKSILNVSVDTLYDDPDSYYNRFIRITGELREHENNLAYAGVGCDTAKYTTSDEFIPDFSSSRQLYVGEKFIGIRIDSHNDLGKVENELTSELKNNQVEIMGIFVPNIVDKGKCEHVIHKSGYILTKFEDITINEN